MKSTKLFLGTTLIAGLGIFGATQASADTYTVQSGDTVSGIAAKYDGGDSLVQQIIADNGISNANLIYVGEQLQINVDGTSSTTEAASVETQADTDTSSYSSTVSGSEYEAKEWIAQKESGGSYDARNGQYIGRYQLTSSYLNGDYSAENQERVADNYVYNRYGSWVNAKNFWLANGWY